MSENFLDLVKKRKEELREERRRLEEITEFFETEAANAAKEEAHRKFLDEIIQQHLAQEQAGQQPAA